MKHGQNIAKLLTPSWIVSTIGITLGVVAAAAVIVISRYQASDLKLQVFNVQSKADPATTSTVYQKLGDSVANNNVFGVAPLFLVWACVGMGVYFFAISIARSFSEAAELHDELEYVHVSRKNLLHEALIHFIVRAIAIVGWFAFIKLSLAVIVPYALALASIASLHLSLVSAVYVVAAVAILYLDVLGHAIFLRLIALKPRLFG